MARYYFGERAKRKWKELTSSRGESSGVAYSPVVIARSKFPVPFEIRYAADIDTPGWVIWLTTNSLQYGDTVVSLTANLTQADQTKYAPNWYLLGLDISNGSVWLIINTAGTSPSARFAAAPSATEGEINIRVATLLAPPAPNPAPGSDTSGPKVVQDLVGALVLSLGGGGGSDYVPNRKPFDIETVLGQETVVRCHFYWDGTRVNLLDFPIPNIMAVGGIYLVIRGLIQSDETINWTYRLSTSPENAQVGSLVYNYQLYEIQNGVITEDLRETFLTLFNPATKLQRFPGMSFVADMRYDYITHQLQKKVGTLGQNGIVQVGNWTMIEGGQATPLALTITPTDNGYENDEIGPEQEVE